MIACVASLLLVLLLAPHALCDQTHPAVLPGVQQIHPGGLGAKALPGSDGLQHHLTNTHLPDATTKHTDTQAASQLKSATQLPQLPLLPGSQKRLGGLAGRGNDVPGGLRAAQRIKADGGRLGQPMLRAKGKRAGGAGTGSNGGVLGRRPNGTLPMQLPQQLRKQQPVNDTLTADQRLKQRLIRLKRPLTFSEHDFLATHAATPVAPSGGGGKKASKIGIVGMVGRLQQQANKQQTKLQQLLAANNASGLTQRQQHLFDAEPTPAQPWNVTTSALLNHYLTNAEMAAYVQKYVKRCSKIARSFTFGKSASGQNDLLALEISINPGVREPKPYFRYTANIHGDEPSGRVLLLLLAEWLCANYRTDGAAKLVVRDMHLILVLSANPDGFQAHRRENSNNVDLNRNFPDPVKQRGANLSRPTGNEQKETLALMKLAQDYRCVASLNLHEGAVVANFPYDGYADGSLETRKQLAKAPDDAVFRFLARTYSNAHPTMHFSKEFADGITNGAQWYPVYGGMQDWVYLTTGDLELTVELNERKSPDIARVGSMWMENRQALLQTAITAGLSGLRGRVFSTAGKHTPLAATIHVANMGLNTTASPLFGDYYRPLPPGTYVVTASYRDYLPATATLQIPKTGTGFMKDFYLHPAAAAAVTATSSQATEASESTAGSASGGTAGGGIAKGGGTAGGAAGGTAGGTAGAGSDGTKGRSGMPLPRRQRTRPAPSGSHRHDKQPAAFAERDDAGGDTTGEEAEGTSEVDEAALSAAEREYLRNRSKPPSSAPVIWTVLIVIGLPLVCVVLYCAWQRRGTAGGTADQAVVYAPVSTAARIEMPALRSAPTGGRPDYSLHDLLGSQNKRGSSGGAGRSGA